MYRVWIRFWYYCSCQTKGLCWFWQTCKLVEVLQWKVSQSEAASQGPVGDNVACDAALYTSSAAFRTRAWLKVTFRFLVWSSIFWSCVVVQVIIQGFRSYRDQTVVDPFSPKHNVIGEYALRRTFHHVGAQVFTLDEDTALCLRESSCSRCMFSVCYSWKKWVRKK